MSILFSVALGLWLFFLLLVAWFVSGGYSKIKVWVCLKREQLFAPKDKWGDPWYYSPSHSKDIAAAQRLNSFRYNKCPHCGQSDLREGPQGPGAVNCLCAACGSKFNDMGFTVDLLRDCTDPIPELEDPNTHKPKPATHNHNGIIQRGNVPRPGSRRAAIQATRQKIANA